MKLNKNFYNPTTASLLIRIGLAVVYLYAGIDAFRQPDLWIGFLPDFLLDLSPFSAKITLDLLSLAQIILAIWLLSGVYIKFAAVASAGFLLGIILSDPSAFIITFRDVPLVFASVALIFLETPVKKSK